MTLKSLPFYSEKCEGGLKESVATFQNNQTKEKRQSDEDEQRREGG